MTSIREAWRRLLGRAEEATAPDPAFSYRVFWIKEVRGWGPEKRRIARAAVEAAVRKEGFVGNECRRRYTVPEIDATPHAGVSLIALLEVLSALEASSAGEGEDDG